MTAIGFYHLTRTGPDQALPQLLSHTLGQGTRAMVLCGSPARLAALDQVLWHAGELWLPHNSPVNEDPDLQPIWLSVEDALPPPNGARYLFLLDGRDSPQLAHYERVFDLFDGRDETATAAARMRWKAARDGGHQLTYWRQTERGWEKG